MHTEKPDFQDADEAAQGCSKEINLN